MLGFKGIQQYTAFRERATRKIVQGQRAQPASLETTPIFHIGDYFHNGKEVLGAVLSWHVFLRSAARKSDFVTSRVLDIIDESIFVGDARRRIKAKDLCSKLDEIKVEMRADAEKIPKDIMKILLGVEEALLMSAESTTTELPIGSSQSLAVFNERQAIITEHLEVSLKMTAPHSEYVESGLNSNLKLQAI